MLTTSLLPAGTILPLLVFAALIFSASLHGLTVAGHFPSDHRAATLRTLVGTLILFGSLVILTACLAAGLFAAWQGIPWYAAIIGGGVMVLLAPLALQAFPDSFVDSRHALVVFALCDIAITLWLVRLI